MMLSAKHLEKTFKGDAYKVQVLKDVSLEVMPGQSIAIMGASGTGKSTLLHILSSLENPDSGQLQFMNQPFDQLAKLRNEEFGFVFQSFFLLEHFSILHNVLMPAKIARKKTHVGSQAFQRAMELLERVGLAERARQPVKFLSGGEKQRVCIARALINNPSIVFADEPTGNLDEETSNTVQNLLLDTIQHEEKALVVVTHDAQFAHQCHQVYELKEGQLHKVK